MGKTGRVAVYIFFSLTAAGLLIAGGLLLCLEATAFRPLPVETIEVKNDSFLPPVNKREISLLTWNIGYAGLGKEMDFFYEGGTMVRPGRTLFRKYLEGICRFLESNDPADVYLFQEVDTFSKRSHFTDETKEIASVLVGQGHAYASNYRCRLVPVPLSNPMGRVESGIVTFARFKSDRAKRWDYGTQFPWPKSLVMLKRCFLLMVFPLENGRKLIVVNTHNSVFDKGGKMRLAETGKLFSFAEDEYRKGNFVILGGDWNMNPKGFDRDAITTGDRSRDGDLEIDPSAIPGWTIAYDPSRPTNRDVDRPYRKGETPVTIIDYFVVSPNLEVVDVTTLGTGFEFSDHQPVVLKVRFAE